MITFLCFVFAFSGLLGTLFSFLMREPKLWKCLSIVWTSFWILMVGYQFFGNKNSNNSAFPAEFMDDRANFVQSITILGESSDLINKPSNNSDEAYTIPKETERQIYSKIEEGLALSKKVDNAFLDYIHPDLKNYYRNKLIAGTEIYYEEIKSNNSGNISLGVQRQIEGINLMTEWVNWWNSHNEDLANKAYPKD
jgi:hypothetical protein